MPKGCQSNHGTAGLSTPCNPSSTFAVRQRAGGEYSTPAKLSGSCQAEGLITGWVFFVFLHQTWNAWRCLPTDEPGRPRWQDSLALTSSGIPLQPERCPAARYSAPLPFASRNWTLHTPNNSHLVYLVKSNPCVQIRELERCAILTLIKGYCILRLWSL